MGNISRPSSTPTKPAAIELVQPKPSGPPFVGPLEPAPVSTANQGLFNEKNDIGQNALQQTILTNARNTFEFLDGESDQEVLNFEQRVTLINVNTTGSLTDKADAVGDYFTELVEDGEIEQAQQLIHAFPELKDLGKSLHGSLINELMDQGKYTKALEINEAYPDQQTKDKNTQYIVQYLIENGETIAAAQASGEGNLSGLLKAEWDAAMITVEKKYDSVVDSVKDMLFGQSMADELAEEAVADIGKQYRQGYLGGGTLACAHTVSRVFDNIPALDKFDSNEVNSLVNQMLSKGKFTQVHGSAANKSSSISSKSELKPGDVVVFSRPRKGGYGHIGVVSRIREDGTAMMVHNSSSKRQVIEVPVNRYNGRMPTGAFRLNE